MAMAASTRPSSLRRWPRAHARRMQPRRRRPEPDNRESKMRHLITIAALIAASAAGAAQAQTIAGSKNNESAIPYFRDLPRWDPNYKAPRTPDGKPDLQG